MRMPINDEPSIGRSQAVLRQLWRCWERGLLRVKVRRTHYEYNLAVRSAVRAGHARRSSHCYTERSDLKVARTSDTKSAGCSQAAKCEIGRASCRERV